jgi:hypothetical protein
MWLTWLGHEVHEIEEETPALRAPRIDGDPVLYASASDDVTAMRLDLPVRARCTPASEDAGDTAACLEFLVFGRKRLQADVT